MWSEEVTNSGLAEKFPKAVHHLCSPSDTIQSVLVEYGVRVHFNRETLMYSYLIKQRTKQRTQIASQLRRGLLNVMVINMHINTLNTL